MSYNKLKTNYNQTMKLLLNIFIVLTLFGCVSSKTAIKETSHVATEQHNNVTASQETNTVSNVANVITDQSQENDSVVTTVVKEILSTPDSTGRQHPTERTTTTQKNYHNKKNDVKQNVNTKVNAGTKSKVVDNSDYKSDATNTAKQTDETKATTPMWIKGVVAFLCLALLVGVYLILRRFGAIKWVTGAIGRLLNKKSN